MIVKIKNYRYQQTEISSLEYPIHAVIFDCECKGREIEVIAPNGNYTKENTALQVMAVCNASPTTIDEIKGQTIEIVKNNKEYYPSNRVCSLGQKLLNSRKWFKEQKKDNSGPPNHIFGGGGPDPGTGNKGGVDNGEGGLKT